MARFATLEAQIEAIETQLSFATLEAQATETRLRDIATGIAELQVSETPLSLNVSLTDQRDDMTSRRVTAFSSVFKLCAQKVAPWTTRLYHHPPSDNDSVRDFFLSYYHSDRPDLILLVPQIWQAIHLVSFRLAEILAH